MDSQEREVAQWREIVRAQRDAGAETPGVHPVGGHREESEGGSDESAGDAAVAETPQWVEELGGFLEIPEVVITGGAREFRREFVERSRPAVIKVSCLAFRAPRASPQVIPSRSGLALASR